MKKTITTLVCAFALLACNARNRQGVIGEADEDLVVAIVTDGNAPDWAMSWVKSYGGPFWGDVGRDVIVLEDGSSIIGGKIDGHGVFAPESDDPVTVSTNGSEDIMLARLDTSGNLVWLRTVGDQLDDSISWVALAGEEHFYAVGYVSLNPVFGQGEPGETMIARLGISDAFLARYHIDGELDWVATAGGESAATQNGALAVMEDGSALVCGFHHLGDSIIFGHDTGSEVVLSSHGDVDGFIARYGPDGNLFWAIPGCVGPSEDMVLGVAADGNTFVAYGSFTGQVTCFGNDDTWSSLESDGGTSRYLARFDTDGRLLWVRDFGIENGSSLPTIVGATVAILENGDIAVAGSFSGTMNIGLDGVFEPLTTTSPRSTAFVSRFNPDGIPLWVAAILGGEEYEHKVRDLVELDDGNIAVVGPFSSPAVFGKGEPNEIRFEPSWGTNGFLALYRDTGHLEWVIPQTNTHVWGIASRQNTILLTGNFWSTAIFGTGGLDKVFLKSSGSNDAFIMRLDRTGIPIDPG